MSTTDKLAEAVRGLLRERNIAARINARKFAEEALAAYEAWVKPAPTGPVMLVDDLTPHEFALRELYEFQQATGCDTAAEFVAAAPAAPTPVPLTQKELERICYEHTKLNPNLADDRELVGYVTAAMRAAIKASKGEQA